MLKARIEKSDVVHIHALWEEPQHLAAQLARRVGIPYVITPHGMLDPWSLSQKKWKKRLYMAWRLRSNLNRAAALHFTTETEKNLVGRLKLAPPGIIEPIGLDQSDFAQLPPRGTFRARYPAIGDRPVLLFLSRLHYKKGLDLLVPAFARLTDRSAVLVIAGPDSDGYRAVVERMVADEGVADRVIFTGMLWNADRFAALADADLFVLSSYQENFGIVVIEALAAGTPAIISDQVNLWPDVTSAGAGAVLPMDLDRWVAELDRWLADPELRRDAAEKGRRLVRERYDWDRIAQNWVGHYRQITEAK
jgi:glycosyltransferase involved in cell wall biosynthesis